MSKKRIINLFWPAIPNKEALMPQIEELIWPKNGKRPFIGEGHLVDKFEEECEKRFGFDYALFTNSGTSAFNLALLGAGINAGDEVITTPLTCTATNLPILGRQAKPVFADVQYETGNIDPKDIEHRITDKTKAIVVVHWGGYPCEMDEINEIANRHSLSVIADGAHALGAMYHGKPISKSADFTMISLQAIKHMNTLDGGLLTIPFKNSKKSLVDLCQNQDTRKKLRKFFGEKINSYFDGNPKYTNIPEDYFVEEIYEKLKEKESLEENIRKELIENKEEFEKFWKDWQKAESLKRTRWFGIGRDERAPDPGLGYFAYPIIEVGGKFHAHNISAAIGLASLEKIDEWQEKRDKIVELYNKELVGVKGVSLFEQKNDRKSGNWLYNIHVEKRPEFVKTMLQRGVECSIVHERNDLLPIFRNFGKGPYKNLDRINEDRICIPLHQNMDYEDAEYVINSIKKGW